VALTRPLVLTAAYGPVAMMIGFPTTRLVRGSILRGSAGHSYARGDLHAARIDTQDLVRATVHNPERARAAGDLNEIGVR
jgi:hypothetical protein